MELKEAIKNRRSIRKFSYKKFDIEKLINILYLANLAPSAGNLQAREFIIVDKKEIKEKIAEASYGQKFISSAPFVVVFCANERRILPYGKRGKLYCIEDTCAAVENFLLSAFDEGLATCWVGAFDEEEIAKILNLPSYIKPVAIVPVGYADEEPEEKELREINDMIHYNGW
ncbi:MAG: nitroreductase family protein [Thermoplasmatales archaeon]|nr:nitroreductase family protein [Thermoplasmatales archaeon]